MNKRYKMSRKMLIFWTIFIGVGALAGSITMFIDPSGHSSKMDGLLPGMQVLPFAEILFKNLIFPGIALLIVNGIPNLIAGILLLKYKKEGIILGLVQGIILMLWIVIQFIIYPLNFMSTIYFIFGLIQFITGFLCYVGYMQSNFKFNLDDYQNIGTNKTKLVVFFSRTGYTKKIAYEIANKMGSEILEIKTTEKINGNLGFWWCGRFGMHHWPMELEESPIDFTKYDEVTICTPIWVFNICAPIRKFCEISKGKIKKVNYIINHFMNCKLEYVAEEMDKLLDTKHTTFESYVCHFGKFKKI